MHHLNLAYSLITILVEVEHFIIVSLENMTGKIDSRLRVWKSGDVGATRKPLSNDNDGSGKNEKLKLGGESILGLGTERQIVHYLRWLALLVGTEVVVPWVDVQLVLNRFRSMALIV
jgi:hypothetical protein